MSGLAEGLSTTADRAAWPENRGGRCLSPSRFEELTKTGDRMCSWGMEREACSEGDGSFAAAGVNGGDVRGTLTSLHPYAGYAFSERVKLWGMAGWGEGRYGTCMPCACC